jgi:valyl-tRNA synthetase
MPFVTEELWQVTGKRGEMLAMSEWPELDAAVRDPVAEAEIDWLVKLVSEVRSVRNEMRVPASAKIPLVLVGGGEEGHRRLATHQDAIVRLARLETAAPADAAPAGAVQIPLEDAIVALPLADHIDLPAEKARLAKEVDKIAGDVKRMTAKLANKEFVAKAPEEVVEGQREQLVMAEQRQAQLQRALAQLGA